MRSLPEKHQTLLFSATMPVEIEALAKVSLPLFLAPEFFKVIILSFKPC